MLIAAWLCREPNLNRCQPRPHGDQSPRYVTTPVAPANWLTIAHKALAKCYRIIRNIFF